MIFRHAISLTINNTNLIAKVFIFTAIMMLVCVAIFVAISNPILEALETEFDFFERLKGSFTDYINGVPNAFDIISAQINFFMTQNVAKISFTIVAYVLLFFLFKYFTIFAIAPATFVIYNQMASNYKLGYINAMVSMLGKTALISLIHALITTPVDLIILVGCILLASWLAEGISIFGIIIGLTLMLTLLALRVSATSGWIPTMVCENKKVGVSIKKSFKNIKEQITRTYSSYLFIVFITFAICMSTAIVTFGVVPMFFYPIAIISMASIALVNYFTVNKQKFYVDERTIL